MNTSAPDTESDHQVSKRLLAQMIANRALSCVFDWTLKGYWTPEDISRWVREKIHDFCIGERSKIEKNGFYWQEIENLANEYVGI